MPGEVISRILDIELTHNAVPGNLGDNRGSSDRQADALKEQDSAQGPNSFFDKIVQRVQGTAAKEIPGEEAQALLAKAKIKR